MICRFISTCLFFCIACQIIAQPVSLDYYLPDISYDQKIPTPQSFLGYQVGEWHVSHDQLAGYMQTLAGISDRIQIRELGRTYERRPLLLFTISSPDNLSRLESIRNEHLALSNPEASDDANPEQMPVVVYQGYSVHGDEASGSNAALLMAYYLAAAQGPEIDKLLSGSVILLDPCLNPDGLQRFSSWVNAYKSVHSSGDPVNREHNEIWPSGRTNHYWFDLNRDWLPLQHPESRGRIKIFHEWKPNILTDHHEMGSNSTFFFQPGIPSRTNPLTPARNQELTGQIAAFHAAELDKIGASYFSEESFDDYYYGKGSTYPDINGAVGILFEQATAAGHLKETTNGILSFSFAIRNQVATSFSTLKAALHLRKDLLEYQRDFYREAWKEAGDDKRKAFVFSTQNDPGRLRQFTEILLQHGLKVYELNKEVRIGQQIFEKGKAHIVPLRQAQYRLARAIFERSLTFPDSLFYDVSAWTLPLAFDLDYAGLIDNEFSNNLLGNPATLIANPGGIKGGKSSYAYLIEWGQSDAAAVLYQLLDKEVKVKVATAPFASITDEGEKEFKAGTLLITVANQPLSAEDLFSKLNSMGMQKEVSIYAIASGLTPKGIDFGSPQFKQLSKPKVMLLTGDGIRSSDAGEIWFTLDQRFEMPVTLADVNNFGSLDLSRYNTIMLASGSYGRIRENGVEKLKDWMQQGGTLLAFNEAIQWAAASKLANIAFKSAEAEKENKTVRAYDMYRNDRGSKIIGGAILEAQLDLSHPLCYGYTDTQLPLFRRGALFMELAENRYATPLRYTDTPLMSGYISKENVESLKSSAAVIVSGSGRGRAICMVDNPLFRAFWQGGIQLFANAVFFGEIIDRGTMQTTMPMVKKE